MSTYPFCYKIRYWKEKENGHSSEETSCGIVFASTYPEAVQQLSEWYGEDRLSDINTLVGLSNEPIRLKEDVMMGILTGMYLEED